MYYGVLSVTLCPTTFNSLQEKIESPRNFTLKLSSSQTRQANNYKKLTLRLNLKGLMDDRVSSEGHIPPLL